MSDAKGQSLFLGDDRIGLLLLKLSLPAFFGMFFSTLYGVINTVFIGHKVGPLAIAGLSIVFPILMLSMGVGMMTGTGGASLISRLIGKGDRERAEHALGNAIVCTLAFCTLTTVVGLYYMDFWLRLMGASEDVFPYARDFMGIILYGAYFQTCVVALSSLIAAEGNARFPMIGTIIGAVLNIIFCWVFVVLFDMGVKGSAFAAVIGQATSAGYLFSYYFRRGNHLRLHSNGMRPRWSIIKDILSIGLASLARNLSGSLSAVFVNRVLIAYGGDSAVSAFGIINQIMMFAIMPCMAISQGLQPIVGFNYGAKHYDKVLKTIKLATAACAAFATCVFVMLYFSPEILFNIFTNDAELITLGSHASRRIFLAIHLVAFMVVGSTVFQAIGKAVQSFIISIARPVLFLVPLISILPSKWHLEGVWLAFPITDVLTFLVVFALFTYQVKMFKAEGNVKD
ncbi:MAG: MATE family efflux transporter [Nitrososphaerota archaeon]|nr:MATE family efflux transporter [Candidatus Bathyarchaeota archaeon]MDW8023606.1 MATE family efflux transporter [Nitrososphaerota archaeon]